MSEYQVILAAMGTPAARVDGLLALASVPTVIPVLSGGASFGAYAKVMSEGGGRRPRRSCHT